MASTQPSKRYSRGYSINGVNGVNGINGINGVNGVNGVNGMNGVNGITSSTTSSRITTKRSASGATFMTSTSNDSVVDSSAMNLVRSTAQMLEKRGTAELGYGVVEMVSNTKFVDVVQYIGNERLSSLPHKGSKWDKVLIRALYFAEQQHLFEKMMKSFGSDDTSAANLGYGYCRLLLELGHENATALDKAFAVLYKHSLEVAALLHRAQILTTTPQIREQLGLMYGDLLTLTSSVATRYYKAVHGMASSKMSLDIYEVCGSVIESFRDRQTQVAELLWKHQAQVEGFDLTHAVPINVLKRWLVPSDPVVVSLSRDHTIHLGGQAEFTCQWFQKELANFAQSESMVMAVTGKEGSGKTVLAASTVERLQRSLGRTSFATLFYSISNTMPTAATKSAVLKSLLAQIFDLRVGNMQTYDAISKAFEHCSHCTNVQDYEGHLWTALEEALKKPLSNARDLIIVVDGIDEMQGGKSAGQAFFEKLADVVCEGKRVKLIGLAQSLSMPSGVNTTHISITHDHVHEDIHAVILRNLAHTHYLTSKPGSEQEQIIERLAHGANASFVMAVLVSQLLASQRSHQDFTKLLEEIEKSKPSVSDMVQRVVSRTELSTSTKTILSWITSAERPLTVSDVRKLLSISVHDESTTDHSPDIHSTLHAVEPLLTFTDGIIRFKHYDIHRAITSLLDSAKITVPQETRHTDLLLRVLKYTRTALDEEIDPTFDEYSPDSIERLFREHTLLPYASRYWILHVQRLGGVSKLPKDFNKILPNVTILSLIERTLFTLELPLPQNLELHKTALQVRQSTLPELSPATLQTTLNTATLYEELTKPLEAAPMYYSATKTSRNLLSNYHPLPVELGFHYLSVTQGSIESKRTEIMTRREEVYKILIILLEKQYGKTSTQVIEVRTILAQFYEHIHEEAHATEIYRSIHDATVQLYGKDSSEAKDTSQHLHVVLGKSKPDQKIETRRDALFDEEDEVHVEQTLDLGSVSHRLQHAKSEREMVELWQAVSAVSRNTSNVEWHEKNIDVATAYSKFLSSQKRTSEASAILSSIAREYENHQVSLSEQIMSRLRQTAMTMKEFGQYAAALAILKRTSEFYQSLRKGESHQSTETQREILILTTEMIQSDSHNDSLEDIFRITIKDYSRAVTARLMSIARQLTIQHIDRSEPSEAIEIARLTLHRTWPAFLTASTRDIEMTTTFQKESIELVELMAQCYTHIWQWDQAQATLMQLWHAIIGTDKVDLALLQKVQNLLVNHYDKNNLPEKAITILQQALAVRKRALGPTNDETIKTLYDLGNRSKRGPALDYFQQIVTYLNHDSTTCHPRAIEAAIYVATTYWEDGRYMEAVSVYTVLWRTFVQKPKEHPQFGKPEFAEQLYERYVQCLQNTGVRSETIYQVTTEYRATCISLFGMQSAVTVTAILALARICYSSEKHASEAAKLYQEASKHSSDTGEKHSEIKHALRVLHIRQISNASSSTISSETVEQSTQQYEASVSQFGYSHSSTLSRLQELAILYYKQNKTEAATKELTRATTEVITKETSSTKLIEAAESIYQAFYASQSVEYCRKMVTELYRQIVWKDTSQSSKFGFSFAKYGRSVLPFLAAMQLHLSSDTKASFTQIMADLTTEMFYIEEYHRVKSHGSLEDILKTASRLRVFLFKIKRNDQVAALDKDVTAIFVTRDGSKIKFQSQSSAQIFMTAIMEWLGVHRNASFLKAVVLASNVTVDRLVGEQKYAEAYDIGNCAFKFAGENGGYHGPQGISHGFNLASDLACVGFKRCPDAALWKLMLQLAKDIATKVMAVCKEQDINFAQLQLRELNRLVVLLGTVEDYETLESLLTTLWSSRDAQSWTPQMVSNLGRRLVCGRYLAGHQIKALRLCEDIAYNLRRTHGVSHPTTRDANVLLAQLYTSIGQNYQKQATKDNNNAELANQYFTKALATHEEMLKLLVRGTAGGSIDDDDDFDSTRAILAEHGVSLNQTSTNGEATDTVDQDAMAKSHLRLLKLGHQRLGSWPKPFPEYEKLIGQVLHEFSIDNKELQTPEKWQAKEYGSGKAESNEGTFEKVDNWELVDV